MHPAQRTDKTAGLLLLPHLPSHGIGRGHQRERLAPCNRGGSLLSLSSAACRGIAKLAAPKRPFAGEAGDVLARIAEAHLRRVVQTAAAIASREGRKTIRGTDLERGNEQQAYIDYLEIDIAHLEHQLLAHGLKPEHAPDRPPAPIPHEKDASFT